MDITVNQTHIHVQREYANETSIIEEEVTETYIDARQSILMNNTTFIQAPTGGSSQPDQARESDWLDRFTQ